jgi:metal-dependent amidase/aminoacylase/carboxypeptidase family protein
MRLYKVVLIEEKINKWAARQVSAKRQTDLKISAATKMGSQNFPQMSDKLPDSEMPQPGNVIFCGQNGV